MPRFVVPVLGALLALIGAVWTLQGAGLLPGSFMTGSKFWMVVGLVALAAGGTVLVRSMRGSRPSA